MKPAISRSAGSTLLIALILTLIITGAVAVSIKYTVQANLTAQRNISMETAQAVGDAYMEWAFGYWRTTAKANPVPINQPTSMFAGLTQPSNSLVPQAANYTISNYKITAVDPQLNSAAGNPPAGQMQSTGDQGYFYLASVDLTMPTANSLNPMTVKVRRVFEKQLSSPWQYAIFYNDILEFHPSPIFSVNGWVHSNGKIYTSPDGGNALNFLDKVTYADSYNAGYAPWDFDWRAKSGTDYATWDDSKSHAGLAPGNTFPSGLPPALAPRADPVGLAPNQFNTGDNNPNNDSYREIIERPSTAIDPSTGKVWADTFSTNSDTNPSNPRYYNYADVKITIDASNNVNVLASDGTPLSTSDPKYQAVVPAISTNQTITDDREGATVRLATIDVSKLSSSIPGWNGVVWISDTSAGQDGTTNKRGIRVKNGQTVPANGITIVTDNPLYVQGDFNTVGTRQPSAFAADAINVLSNNWQDANSSQAVGSRVATATTINAAFLSGNVPTVQNTPESNQDYSGGVENFPRFHESWSGVNFTYNGSMVEMFKSQQAIGRWANASYNPPNRVWAFDPMFRTNPPPGTLMTTSYIKQRWYLR